MEFWLAQVTEIPVAIGVACGEGEAEACPAAMQPVARRPVAERRPEQAKPEPDSAKRLLGLEAAAWRWDRLAQALSRQFGNRQFMARSIGIRATPLFLSIQP